MRRLKVIHINQQKYHRKLQTDHEEKETKYINLVNDLRDKEILNKAFSEAIASTYQHREMMHNSVNANLQKKVEQKNDTIRRLDKIITDSETNAEGHQCIVCKDKLAIYCADPCNHLLYCERCFTYTETVSCPCCRKGISKIFKIYA